MNATELRTRIAELRAKYAVELEMFETNQREGTEPLAEAELAGIKAFFAGTDQQLQAMDRFLASRPNLNLPDLAEMLDTLDANHQRARAALFTVITGEKPGGAA